MLEYIPRQENVENFKHESTTQYRNKILSFIIINQIYMKVYYLSQYTMHSKIIISKLGVFEHS